MEQTEIGQDILVKKVRDILEPFGFEIYPFKIGWYNEFVQEICRLSYPEDTLGLCVISTPEMFEKAFIPFVKQQDCDGIRDPIDQCMVHYFNKVKENFPEHDIESIHEFEMHHSRRPKILVQTVGHVSGATYYYQKSDVTEPPWPEKQKICGVCYHPVYGGWFGLRGVFIFKDVRCPDLPRRAPPDVIPGQAQRVELLEKFNFHWQDWSFRDLLPVPHKYSREQVVYFSTKPKDRGALIQRIRSTGTLLEEGEGDQVKYEDKGHSIDS
uniref:Cyanocobalamin reductase (cyanide-eliminating) n=1 Tax=Crassostrea virginica TaxID=6565 RepID=A0A8B8CPI5_CRAVI|nr:methylmalonic aciduria and homocystinuria type C protein homolog [Crassostrea virginica]